MSKDYVLLVCHCDIILLSGKYETLRKGKWQGQLHEALRTGIWQRHMGGGHVNRHIGGGHMEQHMGASHGSLTP